MKLLKTADEGAYCLQAAGLDLVSRAHDRLRGILKNEAIDFDGAAKDAACFDLLKTRVEKSEDGEKLKVSSQSVALVSSSWLVPSRK